MAAQNELGEVIIGDSHEYGDEVDPFDSEEINDLFVSELRRTIDLPDWSIAARWHGVYPIHPAGKAQFVARPAEGVVVDIPTSGSGMTMAFGLAERMVASGV